MDAVYVWLVEMGFSKDQTTLLFLYALLGCVLYLWWLLFRMSDFLAKLWKAANPLGDSFFRHVIGKDYDKQKTSISIFFDVLAPAVFLWPWLFLIIAAIFNFHTKGRFF